MGLGFLEEFLSVTGRVGFDRRTHHTVLHNISSLTGTMGMALKPGKHGIILRGGFNSPLVAGSNIAVTGRVRLRSTFRGVNTGLITRMTDGAGSITNSNAAATAILTRTVVHRNLGGMATNTGPVNVHGKVRGTIIATMRRLGTVSGPVRGGRSVTRITTVSTTSGRINRLVTRTVRHINGSNIVAVRRSGKFAARLSIIRNVRFSHKCTSPCVIASSSGVRTILRGPCVLVASGGVADVRRVLPMLRRIMRRNGPLLLMTRSIRNRTLTALIIGGLHKAFGTMTMGTPNFNSHHGTVLRSVTVLANNRMVARRLNHSLGSTAVSSLKHTAGMIIAGRGAAVIRNTKSDTRVNKHIGRVHARVRRAASRFSHRGLRRHLTGLTNNITIIGINTTARARLGRHGLHVRSTLGSAHTTMRRNVISNNNITLLGMCGGITTVRTRNSRTANIGVMLHTVRRPMHAVTRGTNLRNSVVISHLGHRTIKANFGTTANS